MCSESLLLLLSVDQCTYLDWQSIEMVQNHVIWFHQQIRVLLKKWIINWVKYLCVKSMKEGGREGGREGGIDGRRQDRKGREGREGGREGGRGGRGEREEEGGRDRNQLLVMVVPGWAPFAVAMEGGVEEGLMWHYEVASTDYRNPEDWYHLQNETHVEEEHG